MSAAHDLPSAIQWHEGMLLAPQHFQQSSKRQEALLHYHTSLIAPFHWGIRHLKIDPILLVEGTFRLLEVEAVMPDGLEVSYLGEEAEELVIDLKPRAEDMRQKPLAVNLAVTALRGGIPAVTGELARYDSLPGQPVSDTNTGEGELRIPRLRPKLRLLLTEDVPKKFVSIPLARVAYSNESFALTNFVPPSLRVPVKSHLGEICVKVAHRLREKAAFLSEQVNSPSAAVRVPQLLQAKQMVHSLVAALPPFEALLYTGVSHPYALYLGLCSLVGHVAAVGDALVPPVLDPFDQNDPEAAFEQAKKYLFQVLDEGINEDYTSFPFYWDDGAFHLVFDEAWMERRLYLGVRSRQGTAEDVTARWMENSLVGTRDNVPALRHQRVRGAEHRRLENDQDLVPGRGVMLFSLAADPQFISKGEPLQVLNLDDKDPRSRPVEIVLFVRNER